MSCIYNTKRGSTSFTEATPFNVHSVGSVLPLAERIFIAEYLPFVESKGFVGYKPLKGFDRIFAADTFILF